MITHRVSVVTCSRTTVAFAPDAKVELLLAMTRSVLLTRLRYSGKKQCSYQDRLESKTPVLSDKPACRRLTQTLRVCFMTIQFTAGLLHRAERQRCSVPRKTGNLRGTLTVTGKLATFHRLSKAGPKARRGITPAMKRFAALEEETRHM